MDEVLRRENIRERFRSRWSGAGSRNPFMRSVVIGIEKRNHLVVTLELGQEISEAERELLEAGSLRFAASEAPSRRLGG